MTNELNNKKYYQLINITSILIPVAVAVLLGIRTKVYLGEWVSVLPHLNGILNSATALLLILGFVFIKQKNIKLHKYMMLSAFGLGSVFLISYILYHLSSESTKFGGVGMIAYLYYFLLISHIILAAVVVRFVLMAIYYALSGQIESHKRVVKWTFPIWLYVSISGVCVYLMISPYYH